MNLKRSILKRLSGALDLPLAESLAAGAARLETAGLVRDEDALERALVKLAEAISELLEAIRGGLPAAAAAVVGGEARQLEGLLRADDA